jgi:hypothetical protein
VEAGLACVAIGFARGEWVLVEVGGSKFFIFYFFFYFFLFIYLFIFIFSGLGLLMPGIDVWVTVAVGFDVWVIGLLNGMIGYSLMAESERERSIKAYRGERERERERERENGRKKKRVGPVTVINWDSHEFSPDLNPDWIKKQVKD